VAAGTHREKDKPSLDEKKKKKKKPVMPAWVVGAFFRGASLDEGSG
jgi:hypothetical protein